jgi:hypothetical protein
VALTVLSGVIYVSAAAKLATRPVG